MRPELLQRPSGQRAAKLKRPASMSLGFAYNSASLARENFEGLGTTTCSFFREVRQAFTLLPLVFFFKGEALSFYVRQWEDELSRGRDLRTSSFRESLS